MVRDLLKNFEVDYDDLVMGLPAGPRVLINDRKTSKPFTQQAIGVDLTRDYGICDIDLKCFTNSNDTKIKKIFHGNSFAKTYLIDDNTPFVRKHIIKTKDNIVHYKKLQRQAQDLERLGFMWEGCTPKIIKTKDTPYDFYFDMEYLDGYRPILESESSTISKLLDCMNEYIYSYKREVQGLAWLKNHLKEKIYPKLDRYVEDEDFRALINEEQVSINDKNYYGLRTVLEKINLGTLKPKFLRPIHGDFTLENVLVSDSGDLKLIDMDGSDYVDAAELDLGKMCQSLMSKYLEWKDIESPIKDISGNQVICEGKYFSNNNLCLKKWSEILKEDIDTTWAKGAFYMSLYFIRFVPFRLKISKDHGIFALTMAIVWLNNVLQEQN